jgi:uncharacterized protein (DUF2141 family)
MPTILPAQASNRRQWTKVPSKHRTSIVAAWLILIAACASAATRSPQKPLAANNSSPAPGPATKPSTQPAVPVNFICDHLRDRKGQLFIIVFDSPDGWPGDEDDDDAKAIRHLLVHLDGTGSGSLITLSTTLPPGTFAAALLHDENNNGEMDKGLFGIPLEGYGFSDNPKVVLDKPSFKTCSFAIHSSPTTNPASKPAPVQINIRVQYWGQ